MPQCNRSWRKIQKSNPLSLRQLQHIKQTNTYGTPFYTNTIVIITIHAPTACWHMTQSPLTNQAPLHHPKDVHQIPIVSVIIMKCISSHGNRMRLVVQCHILGIDHMTGMEIIHLPRQWDGRCEWEILWDAKKLHFVENEVKVNTSHPKNMAAMSEFFRNILCVFELFLRCLSSHLIAEKQTLHQGKSLQMKMQYITTIKTDSPTNYFLHIPPNAPSQKHICSVHSTIVYGFQLTITV